MTPIDFKARVQSLAQAVEKAGAAAYVGTRQASLHWLSGAFMPWRGAVIVTARGECDFVYWAMDLERVRAESWGPTFHEFHFDGFIGEIAKRLKELGCASGTVGLDLSHPGAAQVAPGMLTAAEYQELTAALPGVNFNNGVRLIDDLMLVKSPAEIERLRKAAAVSDLGFRAGLDAIREGVTENFVAGQIEAAIRLHGSNWSWAVTGGTEVGAGQRSAYMRGLTQQATDNRIGVNEFVILDLHPMIDLYLSDTAIPVFHGKPNLKQQRLIDCWNETVQAMLDSLRPGRQIAECVGDGLKVFEKHRLQEFGLPLFGHGLGTCARTRPFINRRSTDVVQPGMVVALGTHIYQPGVGGCRLEYPVLIGEHGSQPLVSTPARVHVIEAR
jgi:Xaa-Pro dipeptidase